MTAFTSFLVRLYMSIMLACTPAGFCGPQDMPENYFQENYTYETPDGMAVCADPQKEQEREACEAAWDLADQLYEQGYISEDTYDWQIYPYFERMFC